VSVGRALLGPVDALTGVTITIAGVAIAIAITVAITGIAIAIAITVAVAITVAGLARGGLDDARVVVAGSEYEQTWQQEVEPRKFKPIHGPIIPSDREAHKHGHLCG
jgi:hypothetical protein